MVWSLHIKHKEMFKTTHSGVIITFFIIVQGNKYCFHDPLLIQYKYLHFDYWNGAFYFLVYFFYDLIAKCTLQKYIDTYNWQIPEFNCTLTIFYDWYKRWQICYSIRMKQQVVRLFNLNSYMNSLLTLYYTNNIVHIYIEWKLKQTQYCVLKTNIYILVYTEWSI